MMKAQGKTQGQAECAITLLKLVGYSDAERFQMMGDKNSKIHAFSKLGLWPFALIFVGILFAAIGVVYKICYE